MFGCYRGDGKSEKINSTENDKRSAAQNVQIDEDGTHEDLYRSRPTRVLIEGVFSKLHGQDEIMLEELRKHYKHHHKFNVINVKWQADDNIAWLNHKLKDWVDYAPEVGRIVAKRLDDRLGQNKKLWDNLKIVGLSMGAHIAGKLNQVHVQ